MRNFLKALVICFTILCLNTPAFAFNLNGYNIPEVTPTTEKEVVVDANNYMKACYELIGITYAGDYFTPTALVQNSSGDALAVNLQVQTDYNVSDAKELGMDFKYPIIYYEKAGGGPDPKLQFLGQTKDGFTITNVRFPMVASWNFLEDLEWVPYDKKDGRIWWLSQYNNLLPDDYPINDYASNLNNSDFAAELDKAIGLAVIPQTRQWGGNEYLQSKVWAVNGAPAKSNQVSNYDAKQATEFPWHKYVNILMPPTYNTWGYGIGFYKYGGSYSYKSFPIAPLKAEVPTPPIVDLTPTPDTQISTGDFELSEKRISKLFDFSDNGGIKTFSFNYGASSPADHKAGSSPNMYTCKINSPLDTAYKYVVSNVKAVKQNLIGTVGNFASNFYGTNIKTGNTTTEKGSGKVAVE